MFQQNAINLLRAEIPFFNYVENKAMDICSRKYKQKGSIL